MPAALHFRLNAADAGLELFRGESLPITGHDPFWFPGCAVEEGYAAFP